MKCKSCTLYRVFAEDGALLYVGATVNSAARLNQHRERHWWREAATVRLEHFDTVEAAHVAEMEAIKSEAPRFNRQTPRRPLTEADLAARQAKRVENARRGDALRAQWAEEEKHTYTADVMCGNCGREGRLRFPNGVRVAEHPCGICGMAEFALVTMRKRAAA